MKRLIILGLFFVGCVNQENASYNAKQSYSKLELDKKCSNGDAQGCYNLGVMYANGKGVKKDTVKGMSLYRKACNNGYFSGCTNLGSIYAEGRDYYKARGLFYKACNSGGDAQGCFNLGALYQNGDGVEKDYSKATKFYKKSCDGGFIDGCKNYKKLSRFN